MTSYLTKPLFNANKACIKPERIFYLDACIYSLESLRTIIFIMEQAEKED